MYLLIAELGELSVFHQCRCKQGFERFFLRKGCRHKQHEVGEMVKAGEGWSDMGLWLQDRQEGAVSGQGELGTLTLGVLPAHWSEAPL